MIEIWGIASGRGTTKDAARGALCARQYQSIEAAKDALNGKDWLQVLDRKTIESLGEKEAPIL